ncbi:hypothetical protein AYO40_04585 [Planctomycetaceae bacterium SCGC AG-212-D15]|nr:hypothetical protein AYO40_04585 [Planctomycetaceae bacterium SCGC AG-212-D15]
MSSCLTPSPGLDPQTSDFYRIMLQDLRDAKVPSMVGGTYAVARYTGMPRRTKDLDLFIRRDDLPRVMEVAERAGYRTELTAPHWLGKIRHEDDLIDVIFGSGNKVCPVDDSWFEHAVPENVLGIPVLLCPVEEMIWSKAFIMERERYDGADVIHLVHARAATLDWQRLLDRFGPNWRVLLSHLILFQFVYPNERCLIPDWVMNALLARVVDPKSEEPSVDKLCRGPLLSKTQYHLDLSCWGYQDARLVPPVSMTPEELATWNTVE